MKRPETGEGPKPEDIGETPEEQEALQDREREEPVYEHRVVFLRDDAPHLDPEHTKLMTDLDNRSLQGWNPTGMKLAPTVEIYRRRIPPERLEEHREDVAERLRKLKEEGE